MRELIHHAALGHDIWVEVTGFPMHFPKKAGNFWSGLDM